VGIIRFICWLCVVVGKSGDGVRCQWDANTDYWVKRILSGGDSYREFMNGPRYLNMVGDIRGCVFLILHVVGLFFSYLR